MEARHMNAHPAKITDLSLKSKRATELDPNIKNEEVMEFESKLRNLLIGQERGVNRMADLFQVYKAGLNVRGKPIGNLLLLGPTGTGKTRLVEATASALYGDEQSFVKIDCGEFQHSHEIAKLIGSPPGYLGHRETSPMLTQETIDRFHNDYLKLSLLLFDEIEKASDALWKLLLGVLDKATLTLGDNRRVDFSKCIIVMTSNLGGGEISRMMMGGGLGFSSRKNYFSDETDRAIYKTALDSAKRKFSPEFINRIDKMIVFRPLKPEHLESILDIELGIVQRRILESQNGTKFVFRCSSSAREFLLKKGTNPQYGARPLKRVIESSLVFPFANLATTRQIAPGDVVNVDYSPDKERLVFLRERGAALIKGGFVAEKTSSKKNGELFNGIPVAATAQTRG